jgi:hypothetical protein
MVAAVTFHSNLVAACAPSHEVAGALSDFLPGVQQHPCHHAPMTEWLGSGLQSRPRQFESG